MKYQILLLRLIAVTLTTADASTECIRHKNALVYRLCKARQGLIVDRILIFK